jgi:molecular chaperone HtpG
VLKLARFKTSTGGDAWRSLGQLVVDFRPNQTAIYYLLGDNVERLRSSPQLESAAARGLEVLLLTDPVDSFWTTMRPDYEGKPLVSLSQGDVDLTLVPLLDTSKAAPETSGKAAVLAVRLKEALGSAVSDVKVSARLVSSAVCLVAPGAGPDLALDRLLSKRDQGFGVKPVLEINPDHPLVAKLVEAGTTITGDDFADLAQMLFDQARILDGEQPADPTRFAATLNRLAVRGLS